MKKLLRSLALLSTVLFWSCSDSDQIGPPGETSVSDDGGIIRMVEEFRNRVSEDSRFSKLPLTIDEIFGWQPNGQGGHAWLLTGIIAMNTGETDYYCNWGWNGKYDGWCDSSFIPDKEENPAYYGYTISNIYINSLPNTNN